MIDTNRLAAALTGTIGLYSGFYADASQPADYHKEPELYLSEANAMLRPSLLESMAEYTATMYFADYSSAKPYKQWDVVKNGSKYYEAIQPTVAGTLTTDTTYWHETTPLSAWFGRIERGAIKKLGLELASNPPVKALLDRQGIFSREGNIQGSLNKSGRFLGCKITLTKPDVAFLLARFGLQLTGAVTNLPVYLFHSSSSVPIKTFNLTGNYPNRSIYVDTNTYLYQQVGGYYVLGFFEADLPIGVNVIGSERGFNLSGCSSCQGSDYGLAEQRGKFAEIQSMFVENANNTLGMVWQEDSQQYVLRQNWGINLIIEARCDVTNLLLSNKSMLTNTLLYMVACDVLEELRTSNRTNADAAKLASMANTVLYGQANSKTDFGLVGIRTNLLSKLKGTMQDLAPSCIHVDAPVTGGLTYGSFFED